MSRSKELAKNTAILAIGKICTQFVTFFLLPIYTRYLSVDEYGTVDLIIVISSLIAPVLSLQLERSVFRFLIDARDNGDEQKKIITTSLSTILVVATISALAMPIIGSIIGIKHILYITALIIITIITNVLLQIPRGLGKNIHFSIAGVLMGLLNAILSIISVVVLKTGIEGVLLSNIIANLVGILYLMVAVRVFSKISISKKDRATLKEMLRFSIPMIPSDIIYWIISVSDRLLVGLFLGSAANGIYAAAAKIPSVIVTAYNVFNMSWIETVSVHIKDADSDKFISDTISTIIRASCSACCVIAACIPFVFHIIIGPEYGDSYNYISILILGAFYNTIIGSLSAIYFGLKRTKDIAKSNILAAIINIGINVALIRVIGIYAAAISTVLAYVVVTITRILNIQKTTAIKFNTRSLLLSSAAIIACTFLSMINSNYLNLFNIAFAIISALLLNRGIIRASMSTINNKIRKR